MKYFYDCPKCNADLEFNHTDDMVSCPVCNTDFFIIVDEECTADYSDCWDVIEFLECDKTDEQ